MSCSGFFLAMEETSIPPAAGAALCAVQAFCASGAKPCRRGNSFAPSG